MIDRFINRTVDSPRTVAWASACSLALGLFFIYVWAPHPWGWQGIDAYHTLSRELADGKPFGTTDVPWGYAYFVAAFYVVFGQHAWIPLTAQVIANASVPLLLYLLVKPLADRRTAILAAVLIGVFSFNTVYASTQTSDAVCTVLFLAALLTLLHAERSARPVLLFGSAVLFGLTPQFRPNLVLFPFVVALVLMWRGPRSPRRVMHVTAFLAIVLMVQAPWIARNYRLTGFILPTSTHGGVQLWYGTLQVGPYLESRAYNPRSAFASAAFPYTMLATQPIVVSAMYVPCANRPGDAVALVYWTDRDRAPRRVTVSTLEGSRTVFQIPPQPLSTTVYYYLEESWPADVDGPAQQFFNPKGGPANPYILFVTADHFGDIDSHDDILDVFDIVRLMRHLAWQEAPPSARIDFDGDGRWTEADLKAALLELMTEPENRPTPYTALTVGVDVVDLTLIDGSTMSVPRNFGGRQTDLLPNGRLAEVLVSRWRTYSDITAARGPRACVFAEVVEANNVFYRAEPHLMQRYMALALDNIGRQPVAFAAASAYRFVRLFVIRGNGDWATTQQFSMGWLAYRLGMVLSATYLLVFLWGTAVAWRQRSALLWLLVPIVYVPLTICFVLTNMRYTITVQPLMFAFIAVALLDGLRRGGTGQRDPDAD